MLVTVESIAQCISHLNTMIHFGSRARGSAQAASATGTSTAACCGARFAVACSARSCKMIVLWSSAILLVEQLNDGPGLMNDSCTGACLLVTFKARSVRPSANFLCDLSNSGRRLAFQTSWRLHTLQRPCSSTTPCCPPTSFAATRSSLTASSCPFPRRWGHPSRP